MPERRRSRDTDGRDTESSPEDLGDLPEGHALFCDGVIPRSRNGSFDRQPENSGRIEVVDGRQAVVTVSHIGRRAALAGQVDEPRHGEVVTIPMHNGQPYDRRIDSGIGQPHHRPFDIAPHRPGLRRGPVELGDHRSVRDHRSKTARRHDRAAASRQHVRDGLQSGPLDPGVAVKADRAGVVECGVHDGVDSSRRLAKPGDIPERTGNRLGSGSVQRRCRGGGSGQRQDRVTGVDEITYDRRAHEPGPSRDQNKHQCSTNRSGDPAVSPRPYQAPATHVWLTQEISR